MLSFIRLFSYTIDMGIINLTVIIVGVKPKRSVGAGPPRVWRVSGGSPSCVPFAAVTDRTRQRTRPLPAAVTHW